MECSEPGCDREVRSLGLCSAHYQQQARRLNRERLAVLNPPKRRNDGPCSNDPAHGQAFRVGLCPGCYRATGKGLRAFGPCSVEGCDRVEPTHRGMCGMHYQRWRREVRPKKKRYRTTTADLVRLVLVIEQGAAGIGGLLGRADGGPLAWPVVEARLLEVHAVLGSVRRTVEWQRAILDMRHSEPATGADPSSEDERQGDERTGT